MTNRCLAFSVRYDGDKFWQAEGMISVSNGQPTIIRTERGLTIAGTRITLYDVMDYVTAQYSWHT